MVSPEVLTDDSLNHNHPDNKAATTDTDADNSNSNVRIEEPPKQPSYLNLACCISGYTTLTNYNSKQREGFRSRDISPARLTGISPHTAAADDASNPAVFSSACGNFLTSQPRYLTEMEHRKKSGDKMWNGNGAAAKVSTSTFTTTTTLNENSSFYHCETRSDVSSSSFHSGESTSQSREVPSPPSSFILQRVERLYGPGALAQGFYTRRSITSFPSSQKESVEESVEGRDVVKESALPVLRFLRPEFRAQLSLAKRKSDIPDRSPNSRPSDMTDGAAVERIIPILVESTIDTNHSKTIEERETATIPVIKDGHYYLKLVLEETDRLQRLATELDGEVPLVPEYMEGRLRAAAGKARLLASQKLAQFKGLCHKNIIQDTSEDFPTTCEDLAGFWDMVSIQVVAVHEEFEKIDQIRKAGWPKDAAEENGTKKAAVTNGSGGISRRIKSAPVVTKSSPAKSTVNKARDEARKKMLAERRREMRNNNTTANGSEDILIV